MEGTRALGRSGHERPVSGEPTQARAAERSLQAKWRLPGSSSASRLRPQLLFHRELHRGSPSIPCAQSVTQEGLMRLHSDDIDMMRTGAGALSAALGLV